MTQSPAMGTPEPAAPNVECGAAGRPLPGEQAQGDVHVVAIRSSGVLVAVIDGIGHGPAAAEVANHAADVLRASTDPVEMLLRRCHQVLDGTRGCVMSLAEFHPGGSVSWLGVGNVQGVLLRSGAEILQKPEGLLVRGGVVGHRLPTIEASHLQVSAGDMLILTTDGIAADYLNDLRTRGRAQAVADRILANHARSTDDGLVLVARYIGP